MKGKSYAEVKYRQLLVYFFETALHENLHEYK